MKSLFLLILFNAFIIPTAYAQDKATLGKLYQEGNYQELIQITEELLIEDPKNPYLNMLMGRSYVDLELFDQAIPYLIIGAEGKAAAYINAWSNAYLGTAYYMVGQPIAAKAALKKTIYAKATKNASKYATDHIVQLGLYSYFNEWTVDSTVQIIFHFQDESLLDKSSFMESRQEALTAILKIFPAELPKKIDFYVWESAEEATQKFHFTLGFSRPEYLITHSRKNQTTGHELAHIVTHHALHPQFKSRFINEGTAVLFDQKNTDRLAIAQAAVKEYKQAFSIEALWKDGAQYPETLLYPVAGAFMEYCYKNLSTAQFQAIVTYQTWEQCQAQLGPILSEKISAFETLLK